MSNEVWPKDCDGHLMNCFLRQAPIQTHGPAGNISSNRYRQRGNNSNWGSGNHKICYRWNEQGMQGCRGCNYAHVCLTCASPEHRNSDCQQQVAQNTVAQMSNNNFAQRQASKGYNK